MRARSVVWLLLACGVVGGLGAACFSEADNCLETDACGGPDAGGIDSGILLDARADAGARNDAGDGDAGDGDAGDGDAGDGDAKGGDAADGDAAGEDAAKTDAALDDGGPALDGDVEDSTADRPSGDAS
jgi:hypothetical protein